MLKILLVEDDPDVADCLQEFLSEEGFAPHLVRHGVEALDHLECLQYDVILLDCMLPGLNGMEVCRLYRRSGGATPIIIITGESRAGNAAVHAGANLYIEKPFELSFLKSAINGLVPTIAACQAIA